MFAILAGIIGLIAAGIVFAYIVIVTLKWLKDKIKEKLAAKKAQKVAVADIEELIDNCENTVSMSDLEDLSDEGYTHLIATVDNNGEVSDVDVVEDISVSADRDVERFINRTHEGMVVIER